MIFFDSNAFPCDKTGDGGDSAVRAGILKMTKSQFGHGFNLLDYQCADGVFVRHPFQEPWNNPKNLTWDNKLMLLAGFNALGLHDVIGAAFKQSAKRFFFGQNIERDKPGSRKYPYPHTFVNDKGETETRKFDFADPEFWPNRLGVYIIGGRIKWLYPFLPIAYLWHFRIIVGHALSKHDEENQMIAECDIYGTKKLYRLIKPRWSSVNSKYWGTREEKEYHYMLNGHVNNCVFRYPLNSKDLV